jgi:hypothetical protein
VLLAWNADRMVMSFRGTASFVNVLADLQVPARVLQRCWLMVCRVLLPQRAACGRRQSFCAGAAVLAVVTPAVEGPRLALPGHAPCRARRLPAQLAGKWAEQVRALLCCSRCGATSLATAHNRAWTQCRPGELG